MTLTTLIRVLAKQIPTQYRRNTDVIPISVFSLFQALRAEQRPIPIEVRTPHSHHFNGGPR